MQDAPKPFSSDWNPMSAAPPPRGVIGVLARIARWLPGERLLSGVLVAALVLAALNLTAPRRTAHEPAPTGTNASLAAQTTITDTSTTAPVDPTAAVTVGSTERAAGAGGTEVAMNTPASTAAAPAQAEATKGSTTGDLLPNYRILTYYGFPGNPNLGILGEYSPEELLPKLQAQADAYEKADPSRPVKIAFEVIASVAQGSPGADNKYIADTSSQILNQYADFCEKHGILLFLDLQFGFRTVPEDTAGLEPWLKKPFVHLALDPEFHLTTPGEVPGKDLGAIDGSDVTWAQKYLVNLSEKYHLPPKVLIVHQFNYYSITNKETIKPMPGVQLVVDEDGFGSPELKKNTYDVIITQHPIEFNGIKLFYDPERDNPLMTPEEVLKLDPSPDLIIYQ
jgi:hypothetical protein